MMKQYIITKDAIVVDRGTNRSDRFRLVKDVPKSKEFQVLYFYKGNEYVAALRTEVGQFLLDHNYLEEVSDGDIDSTRRE